MKKYSYCLMHLSGITFFLLIFLIPVTTEAYCDVGSVTAQNARAGLIGSSFGDSAVAECESQNTYNNSYNYPTSYTNDAYIDYLTDLEVKRLEAERDKKLDDIKLKYDKECKEKETGPNSHFDEKLGCTCNVGYQLFEGSCKDKDIVFNQKFDKLYYSTILNLPEYKDIVDKDYLRNLARDPKNSSLTLTELIKNTYAKNLEEKIKSEQKSVPVSQSVKQQTKIVEEVGNSIQDKIEESQNIDEEQQVEDSDEITPVSEPQKKSIFKKLVHFISFGWLFK